MGKYRERKDMQATTDYITAEETRTGILDDECIGPCQNSYSVAGYQPKLRYKKDLEPYWSFRELIININYTAMKGRKIIILTTLQDKDLKPLHFYHMGVEKTKILACDFMSWINMNAGIEEMVKYCPTCLDFQAT